jgi:hypothetical protein
MSSWVIGESLPGFRDNQRFDGFSLLLLVPGLRSRVSYFIIAFMKLACIYALR